MIPIFEPYFIGNETKYINQCLKTKWISSQGSFVKKFEKKLCDFHKMKYCLVTSSCTSALHLSLLSFEFKENDEVICPSLSFIAPANMIILSKLKLVFVDIDKETLNIDADKIEKKITKRTKAIVPVHFTGYMTNMPELIKISKKFNIPIIEDACQSILGSINNKNAGTCGITGAFSLHP